MSRKDETQLPRACTCPTPTERPARRSSWPVRRRRATTATWKIPWASRSRRRTSRKGSRQRSPRVAPHAACQRPSASHVWMAHGMAAVNDAAAWVSAASLSQASADGSAFRAIRHGWDQRCARYFRRQHRVMTRRKSPPKWSGQKRLTTKCSAGAAISVSARRCLTLSRTMGASHS